MNKRWTLLITTALGSALAAQATPPAPVISPQTTASASWLGGFIRPSHLNVPGVQPMRPLRSFEQDGQLHLSLQAFLDLVLSNNPNVHLQQLNNWTAAYDRMAANSPFDPKLTLGYNSTRAVTPEYSQINGAPTLSNLSQQFSLNFSKVLASGQQLQFSFGGNRYSSNSAFSTFNPSLGANVNFELVQPLWRNRTNLQNRVPLLQARVQVLVTTDQTAAAVANLLVSAADQYWQTVEARDQITVRQQAMSLAQQSYDRDQQALKLGALAPGDIFTSQTQVAQDQVALLQAQSSYEQQLDALRRLIGADQDASIRDLPVSLDDDPSAVTPAPPPMAVADAITQALANRPEMDATSRTLASDSFGTAASRDALRPQLNLTGSYGSYGLAGNTVAVTNNLGVAGGGAAGGFSNALGQVFGFGYPTYGVGLALTLPLHDSAAQANYAKALAAETRDRYQQLNERQQVTQDVRVADTQLRMAVATVQSATTARDLAQKNVAAEQQKYQLGGITMFELLQAQVQLSQAQSTLLDSYTNYQIALISYERATWTLLDKLHLRLTN